MIRVLAVDHTAGIGSFRKKFVALAAYPDIDLTVLAPRRWVENYRSVEATPFDGPGYRFRTGSVGWPGYENRAFFRAGLGPLIRGFRPDILHLWEEPFSLIALQAIWHAAVWAPRAKVIFFSSDNLSRNFRYSYRPSWFYANAERLVHSRCAGGTAVSEEVAEVLRAKGFRKPIRVIPHGLDLADYPGTESGGEESGRRATRSEVIDKLGLEPPIMGYVGRLLYQKGVDVFLRAIGELPDPKPSILVVGDGPDRAAFEALSVRLGLGDRTRFLQVVPHGSVSEALACVDVLVLPSRTTPKWKEQFGRVLIEGMAAGCVVIGSSSGSIPEVLADAGLIVPEGDVGSLVQAIRQVLGDPELAASLRVRGRKRVRERYTWESISVQLRSFYRDLLDVEVASSC